MGEFRFAADVLLFWSAILLLPSDRQLFHSAHSVQSVLNRRIHRMALTTILKIPEHGRTGNKKPPQVFTFQNGSKKRVNHLTCNLLRTKLRFPNIYNTKWME